MGLMAVFGTGAGTSSYDDFHHTDFILLVGSNAPEAHPIIFHHIMTGGHNGAELVVGDPRQTLTTKRAHEHFQIAAGSDIALLNVMAPVIIRDKRYYKKFVERGPWGLKLLRSASQAEPPARTEQCSGGRCQAVCPAFKP